MVTTKVAVEHFPYLMSHLMFRCVVTSFANDPGNTAPNFLRVVTYSGHLSTIHCNPLTSVAIWDSFRSAYFRLSIEKVIVLCILSTNPMISLDLGCWKIKWVPNYFSRSNFSLEVIQSLIHSMVSFAS